MGCTSSNHAATTKNNPMLTRAQSHRHQEGTSFDTLYAKGTLLGHGAFGSVHVCIKLSDPSKKFAVKLTKKNKEDKGQNAFIRNEIDILMMMKHPNIMYFEDCFEDDDYVYIVTELLPGGELFDQLVQRTCFNEKDARDIVHTLLLAVKYCHDNGIVHR